MVQKMMSATLILVLFGFGLLLGVLTCVWSKKFYEICVAINKAIQEVTKDDKKEDKKS